jgi:signal transduction histidine kinase
MPDLSPESCARIPNDVRVLPVPAAPAFVFRVSRMRFAVPMIIASAALGILVNEVAYKNTVDALRIGSSLTEARIAAGGVLQLLTDAETGQRGYLLTDRVEYLSPLDAAKLEVPRMRATVSSFLEASGADGHAASLRMAEDIRETLAEIERTVGLVRAGDRGAALQIIEAGVGRRRMDDMRGIFNTSLLEAANRQQVSRASIDDSLWTNRIAVATLTLLGAIALSFYVRHLRLHDLERADRQLELEGQVTNRTVELRQLAGYLLTAREDEKAHLARELHDEMGGVLTAAKLDMARMRRVAAADPVMLERIEQVSRRLSEGIAIKRRIVEDLRPSCLDTLGLTISLSNLCSDVAERLGIPVLTDLDDVSLSADEQLALYRLVQEALTNVSKYARASGVHISLKAEPSGVRVSIEDDGIGFDTTQLKAATHGIAGMRFRIERLDGTLSVDSKPGLGTRLVATLPTTKQI